MRGLAAFAATIAGPFADYSTDERVVEDGVGRFERLVRRNIVDGTAIRAAPRGDSLDEVLASHVRPAALGMSSHRDRERRVRSSAADSLMRWLAVGLPPCRLARGRVRPGHGRSGVSTPKWP